ncbi:MAG: hypothetical protein M0P71_16205 [Melioribacteraceae bacterium]|nr:hypothetical protein [Melioribacteraceae bacterium]
MSQVTQTKKSLMVMCDCGAIHTITNDEDNGLQISSYFKKQPITPEPKPIKEEKENGTPKKKSAGFYESLFGAENSTDD